MDDGRARRAQLSMTTTAMVPSVSSPPASASASFDDVEVVVLDFDLTLLRVHSFASRVRVEDLLSHARDAAGDFVDVDYLMVFLERAKARNLDVKIASFGIYEVIQTYMDIVIGQGAFGREDISTPSVVGVKDGCSVEGGKNAQLERFVAKRFGADAVNDRAIRRRVVLFDDDEKNIEAAVNAGYRAVHTPDGFTRRATRELFDALAL